MLQIQCISTCVQSNVYAARLEAGYRLLNIMIIYYIQVTVYVQLAKSRNTGRCGQRRVASYEQNRRRLTDTRRGIEHSVLSTGNTVFL